jgi:hypothetical protein
MEPENEIDEAMDGIAFIMYLYKQGFIDETKIIHDLGQFQFRVKNVVLQMHAMYAPENEDEYDFLR